MNKKGTNKSVRLTAQQTALREKLNQRIEHAAT